MVVLTATTGTAVAVNADLIESARGSSTGLVLTLVNGKTFAVTESIDELVGKVASFRGAVLAAADCHGGPGARTPAGLRLVHGAVGSHNTP